jgi:hypothetical protein
MKPYLSYSILLGTIALSCAKPASVEGPLLEDLYGDFALIEPLEVSSPSVDLAEGERVYFSARFNKTTNWELELQGLSTGAVKRFSGKTRALDETNALWNGSTSEFPVFGVETVAARLWVPEANLELFDTLEVLSPKPFEGLILADFEGVDPVGWLKFAQTGANMSFARSNQNQAAQGQYYFDMGGTVNWDWLICYLYMPAAAYPDSMRSPNNTLLLPGNPDQVYLNLAVYSPDGISNEVLLIRVNEDDNLNGSFSGANEDQYSIELKDIPAGWNSISIPYTDLETLVNGQPGTPAGNGIREPDKIHQVEFLFLANPSSGYSQIYLDYVVFTSNGPWEP